MKGLFGKELCNTGRQFEFDFAKAVCILGMVFVHCFEELTAPETEATASYYIMTIVLDAIFGAATFMGSMGLGIAYSMQDREDFGQALMKRGIYIFIAAYVLNLFRFALPGLIFLGRFPKYTAKAFWVEFLVNDIMQFAGLALFLFGLLKKLKLSDKAVLLAAVAMSAVGSFVRLIPVYESLPATISGLFIGVYDQVYFESCGVFPLLNWFIIVIEGYFYGKLLRHCKDTHKFYKIALPISAVILAVYMAICIPNGYGMMNPEIFYYYHMTTPNTLICLTGMIFATSCYHFIGLLLGDKVKKGIGKISSNINTIYCIHWVIIGTMASYFESKGEGYALSPAMVFGLGCVIYIVSSLLADAFKRCRARKAVKQN